MIIQGGSGMVDTNNRMVLNPNPKIVEAVTKRIIKNDGYCPCRSEKNDNTMCPCVEMLTDGKCCCHLFVSAEDAYKYRREMEGINNNEKEI